MREQRRIVWLTRCDEPRAKRFYARYGFAFAGEYAFIVGEQRDREFMYRREPAPA